MSIYVSNSKLEKEGVAVAFKALDKIREIWKLASKLKLEERRGWAEKTKIRRPESVADHSFAVSLLALVEAQGRGYNVERTVKLALIHDLEEAITGDLTPHEKEKQGSSRVMRKKRNAMEQIIAVMPVETRIELRRLWRDLSLNQSKEARLVHELDKLEMALQAHAYAKRGRSSSFADFYDSANKEIKDPRLRRTLEGLRR